MKFIPEELGLINHSIRTTAQMTKAHTEKGEAVDIPVARTFHDIGELKMAIELIEKLLACANQETKQYLESELEFSTAEKTFILKLIDRPWTVEQGKYRISLITKLS